VSQPIDDRAYATSTALREAKQRLRERVLRERDAMPAQARASAAKAIAAALLDREDFAASATLLLTLPFGSEWDTRPVLDAALDRRKRVVLPRVNRPSRMLELCAVEDIERDAAPGDRGIFEPGAHCALVPLSAVDWVLVPGVAFDTEGHRVGYGGGYYDRLLPLLRSDAARVAGAFELQVVDRVPAAMHDVAVDALVTETRSLSTAR
jgi:5-formyltetrahydrofolate cyclo-ligase